MKRRLLLIALAVMGCKKSDDEDGKTIRPPDLQMINTGSEPRRVLRYQLAKGNAAKLELTSDVEAHADDIGGPLPTFVMDLAITAEDTSSAGAKLRTTVIDMQAREKDESRVAPNALGGPLDGMRGIVLTATLTPTGRLRDSMIVTKPENGGKPPPKGLETPLAMLSSSFENVAMPLPDEAVGVGAMWRSSRALEEQGMKLTAVNTVNLVSINGDQLAFDLETEIHGDDQTVKQGDLSVDVKDITGTGSGKATVDLKTLAVTSEVSAELRSAMQSPGETKPTQMRMAIKTKIAPH